MTKADMTKYLETLRELKLSCYPRIKHEFYYFGLEDFLLREATWFEPPTKLPRWQGAMKQCFHNARIAAKRYRWKYVEGMANSIIPVHHAWCVDDAGQVQEVTWEKLGDCYVGVVFDKIPKECVFDNWGNYDIYKEPFKKSLTSNCEPTILQL
jgi:hypothetical protein